MPVGHSLQIVRSAARSSSTTRNFFAWPARLSVAIYTRVGPHRALELGLLGETISAEEAVRIGLASRSVPADAWRSTVDDMALRLATGFNRNLALRKLGLYERARAGPGLCARYKIARRHRPHGCNVREPGMETYKHSSSKSDGTPKHRHTESVCEVPLHKCIRNSQKPKFGVEQQLLSANR